MEILYIEREGERERERKRKRGREREREREKERERDREKRRKEEKGKKDELTIFSFEVSEIFPHLIFFFYTILILIFTFLVQCRIQFRFLGRIHPVSQENQDLGGKNPDPRQLFYL